MEQAVLTDKSQFPTQDIIEAHLGKSKHLWYTLFDYIHASHLDFTKQWRYYNDGKSWLLKITRKSKTIFWLSVFEGSFRITFYFTEKAKESIQESHISDELKDMFLHGKKSARIKGITIRFKDERDIEYAKLLIDIKLSIK